MSISAVERRNWTNQGAQDAAQRTYSSVKAALDRSPALSRLDWEAFLQGSYANHTNTRGDSDVDVVVMLKSSFTPDTRRLPPADQVRYEQHRVAATVTSDDFRGLVHQALDDYYGSQRVQPKDKCLRVDKAPGYVDADVVPALQHRLYNSYPQFGQASWIEGIAIHPLSGGRIVNFPKQHRLNGEAKNGRCSSRYKPTVRQIKRLRRRAVDLGLISKDIAPGYLIECLVYNVPDNLFGYDDSARMSTVLKWLHALTPEDLRTQCKSCDEVHHLFIDDPGDHDEYSTERMLDALWKLL
ncbi:nucleotidyltransferase [Micromonospora sp. NPDC049107]|uniref:nucleotidyltransferase domain-containing protein n=1 Tax=Micromonospora sp. NPDC049107 TaxID=3154349 RepID=UPI0033DEEA55